MKPQIHHYDRNTRDLLLAIDQNRLLPDLIELLDETNQTNYYDISLLLFNLTKF